MKTKLTLLAVPILIFSITNTFSQLPVKQWDADFGGTDNEQFAAAQQTKDGGYIIGGFSESGISGDKTQASRGASDYWIVKTDANGLKQWDKRFGGTSVDELTCLQQTTDDGYILGGFSFSGIGGDKTQASQGSSDYWIVKIDANGVKQWDARFGGSSFDELYSLQQTSDGGYILGGASFSGISGDKTQESRGGKDFWIVKTDSRGVKQWDARFGGTEFEELFSIRQSADGGFIMGGYSLSGPGGDKTDPARGRFDYWVVKTNDEGLKQWDAAYGGKDDDWLSQIRQTNEHGYILGGWSWSGNSGDKSQNSRGDNDYWIIKIDGRGVRQWDAAFGGSSNDYLGAVEQTADGGYILGGYSSSPVSGEKTQPTQGGTDYWMVKTDPRGVKQWDIDFGGTDFDFLYATQQTLDGGYVLGGYSSSNAGGDKTQNSKGLNDYWVVKTTPDGVSCNIPANLRTTAVEATEATLVWNAVPGAMGYVVSYRVPNGSEWTVVKSADNRKQLRGLIPGLIYEWSVKSVCNSQQSAWAKKESFVTDFSFTQSNEEAMVFEDDVEGKVYPNPMAYSAIVSFSLSKSSSVVITVNDMYGKPIKTIANRNFPEGMHKITLNRESLAAGFYLLQLKTNNGIITKKLFIE